MQTAPGGDEILRLRKVGREMEVGEQNLSRPQERPFRRERLLDLHHHLGAGEDFRRRLDEFGPGARIVLVRGARAGAGALLDDGLVPVMNELCDRGRRHADTEFIVLDLFGNADEHGWASTSTVVQSWRLSLAICRPFSTFRWPGVA